MELGYPSEAEYAEAFGVELKTEENGAESAVEGFESQDDTEGTASAETPQEGQGNGVESSQSTPDTSAAEDESSAQPAMSPEERHRQAAARRAREERERQQAEQARRDMIYAEMFAGQTNPYTGKPINTEAEYRAYQAERSRRQQAAQLQRQGIDPTAFQNLVNQQVEQQMAPIKQQMEAARMENMRRRAAEVNQRAEAAISVALKNIRALDPGIKSLKDISKMPTATRFNQLVQAGVGLEDAFYLANRPAIDNRKAAAAREAARTQAAGKGHLAPVTGNGQEIVRAPQGVREAYLEMMPGATDAEINAAYAKAMKEMK